MTQRSNFYRTAAVSALIALIILTFLWEWKIAPLRAGGSWLALKALPLCLPLSGCLKGKKYTFQYALMLVLFYPAEGIMRLTDANPLSRLCAVLEILLGLAFFVFALLFVRSLRPSGNSPSSS